MISDKLIHRVQQRFPDYPTKFDVSPAPIIIFAARHPEVGDIQIYDNGNEVRLVAGRFTHGHFSDFTAKSKDEAQQNIVEDVIAFLDRMFADQVVMWGSHHGAGGWYKCGEGKSDLAIGELYVWSGPLAKK